VTDLVHGLSDAALKAALANPYQAFFDDAVAHHQAGRFDKAAFLYNRLLNRRWADNHLRFYMADLFMRQDQQGLALNLLHHIVAEQPNNSQAWCNLGVCYRKENFYEKAESAWKVALAIEGDSSEVCGNMAGLHADTGRPEQAIHWCDRALAKDPTSIQALWQKAMAKLTLREWAEGWDLYEARRKQDTWDARKTIEAPDWVGEQVDSLYLHGEQGVGDEVMFLALVGKAVKHARLTVLEVNPKVAELAHLTCPSVHVITEEKLAGEHFAGAFRAKLPIGSLARLYWRNSPPDGLPYLKPDPGRVAEYRRRLAALGPHPWIGLAWFGGLKQTRVEERTIPLEEFAGIMKDFTCVSVQYDNTVPVLDEVRKQCGLPKFDDGSVGGNLADQAALMAALDVVVTVMQTAVHVAGGVGARCLALIPPQPTYQFGRDGDTLPFYQSVRLIRRSPAEEWAAVIARAHRAIETETPTRAERRHYRRHS
jgi:tetratricopeptide (TPR) repeat protein